MNHIKCTRYTNDKGDKSYGRLLVLPLVRSQTVSEGGLIIPEDVGKICEEGEVFETSEGSDFKRGDVILYRKVNRLNRDEYTSVFIHGVEYDAISESEVWSVNEKPHNRIFVKPISDILVGEDEIIIPEDVKGIPQKGRIMSVGFNSLYQEGDIVEYRKPEQNIFPTVNINGDIMDVLFESDVYTVNEKAASHRIIVKIDLQEQSLKRSTTESGLALSPLFEFMLRNLQYGEIVDIGAEAQLRYPQLEKGDTAILHHTVESQPYRFLKADVGKYGKNTYEYRIINITNDPLSREIFGKVVQRRLFGRIHDTFIVPFDKNIFLKWNFDVFEPPTLSDSLLVPMDYTLNGAHDIEDFRVTLARKKQSSVTLYKSKSSSIINQLKMLNPEQPENKQRISELQGQMAQLQREIFHRSYFLNKNHLLKCSVAYPKKIDTDIQVVAPFNELYPINLFGKKYLIAHSDLIIGTYMDNTLIPMGKKLLVLPIEEGQGLLQIPDSAKERPLTGKVISVGSKVEEDIIPDDIVHFKKTLGTEVVIDKVAYLCLHENDLLLCERHQVAGANATI